MTQRTISLVSLRPAANQRAHFGIFVPSAANPQSGTLINVVGAPMTGFLHEFKRNYNPYITTEPCEIWPIGSIDPAHIVDWPEGPQFSDTNPNGNIEIAACQVPAPGISQNFMAPVNDTTNRRCQEWTMDYLRHLVARSYIGAEAVEIVQSKRDPPGHGIGLRPVGQQSPSQR